MSTTIDQATYDVLAGMHAAAGVRGLDPSNYTIVQPAAPAADAPAADASPTGPAAAGWDTAAFDALPEEHREAVAAGMASMVGKSTLQTEAAAFMARPEDVHRYLTDPAKYVNSSGVVDRAAMRTDLEKTVTDRPELSRHARVNNGRHAPTWMNGGPAIDSTAEKTSSILDQMHDAAGVRRSAG